MGTTPVEDKTEVLLALYPRDLAREMVKEYSAALPPPEDPVILPGMTVEELEKQLAELIPVTQDLSPEELVEAEKIKQSFRDVRGKKVSELPPPTPEEEAAEIEEEVDMAIANVLGAWINTLYEAWSQQLTPASFGIMLTETLEPVTPINLSYKSLGMTWQKVVCESFISLTPEQVGKLHEAFAANLRPLIDAAPEGYVILSNEFYIRKDPEGYCLGALYRPRHK